MKKHLKVEKEIISYECETNEENKLLKLSRQEYKFIQKFNTVSFPQNFVDQETGIEYELFDVFETTVTGDQIVAQYEPIGG